uniref:Uncharacterized protein n=1 Tax=Syphacia muris TaxID=451379 RepID=A0A0N5AD92_9BILA
MFVRKSQDCFSYADDNAELLHNDLTTLREAASTSYGERATSTKRQMSAPANNEYYESSSSSCVVINLPHATSFHSTPITAAVVASEDATNTEKTSTTAAATETVSSLPPSTPTATTVQQQHSPHLTHKGHVIFSQSSQSQQPQSQQQKQQQNMAKHIINKQLRKYASEANFALVHESNETDDLDAPTKSHQRVYIVQPSTYCSNRINGGGTVFGRLTRNRKASEESGSFGSDATVASGSLTPLTAQRLAYKMRRPKSTGQMTHYPGELNASRHSDNVQSFDSLKQLNVPSSNIDDRRPSNLYVDEDSTHEVDYEDGNVIFEILSCNLLLNFFTLTLYFQAKYAQKQYIALKSLLSYFLLPQFPAALCIQSSKNILNHCYSMLFLSSAILKCFLKSAIQF